MIPVWEGGVVVLFAHTHTQTRGAKTAMALALGQPGLVQDVIAVDNAPVDAVLSTDFAKYVRGMKKVEDANVSSQKEADRIFAEFEEVGVFFPPPSLSLYCLFCSSFSFPPSLPTGRRFLGGFPSSRCVPPLMKEANKKDMETFGYTKSNRNNKILTQTKIH